MDLIKLKASLQMAQLRAGADDSEDNLAILKDAQEAYDFAANPENEKKTEEKKDQAPIKTVIKEITNNPLKKTTTLKVQEEITTEELSLNTADKENLLELN